MKKLISVLLIALLCLSLTVAASADEAVDGVLLSAETLLFDDADLLSDAEEAELSAKLQEYSSQYNAQLVVVTLASLNGEDIDYFVEYLYDSMGFGYGENKDGVLLLVAMDVREYRILSNGYAGDAITVDTIESMGDNFVSYLSDGYYADAFDTFAEDCAYYLDGYLNGFPFHFGATLFISLVIGFVVGLIVVLVLKGQLKSVRKQDKANNYIRSGSMQVTLHRDLFLYRDVSRVRKQTNNSSSGGSRSSGGGSRSVGGGKF